MNEIKLRSTIFAGVTLSALLCHFSEREVVEELEVVEEVAADMRAARRVMLRQLCPCHPLPPPAGDPAATADEVAEEVDDIFGAGFHDDIDEEHHDDTDGEQTDEEGEVLEYFYGDGVYGGEREDCGPEDSPDEVKAVAEEVAKEAELIGLMDAAVEEAREEDASAPGEPSSSSDAPHPGDELPDPSESGYIYFEGRSVLRVVRGQPKSWLCINCYFHRSCQVTMKLSEEPPLRDIKRWARSVDPTPPDAGSEVNKALAAAHKAKAKELWPHCRVR